MSSAGFRLCAYFGAAVLLVVYVVVPAISVAQVTPGQTLPNTNSDVRVNALPGTTSDSQGQVQEAGRRPDATAPLGAIEADDRTDASASGTSTVSFRLNGIEFPEFPPREFSKKRGNFTQISEIYDTFLGKEVTIGDLREIANRIEKLYREEGYLATRVLIPPQTIEGGIAQLQVHEGRIIHYEINGDIGKVKDQIAALLDNLLTEKAARRSDVERYLLLSRDLPGISLTGTLRSAGDSLPGGVILVVDTARKAVDGFVQVQNKNAKPTGSVTLAGGVASNSETEYAERVGAIALAALDVPEQFSGFASAEMSVGNDGLVVRLETVYGMAEPGDELEALDLNLDSFTVKAEAEYPLVRSRGFSLWTRGGFEYADSRSSIGDKPDDSEFFDDQLRVLYAGFRGIWFGPFRGQAEFDLEFRKGIDFFGSSATVGSFASGAARSRSDGKAEFELIRGELSYLQPIWPFFKLYGKVAAQWSDDPLLTYEEMAFGELTFGRGFEPGTITGDQGFGITGELRFQPPGMDLPWLDDLEFYGFIDYGRAYDFGEPTNREFEHLTSLGLGARFQILEMFYGDVYIAAPQSNGLSTLNDQPDTSLKFTFTQFF